MKGTIEKALATPLDPRFYVAFEAVQPAISQSQAAIGQVGRQLVRRASRQPVRSLAVQRNFWSRLGIAQTWVTGRLLLSENAHQPLAEAHISTFGNSSQSSLHEAGLRDRLVLTSQNDYEPVAIKADQARFAVTALAECALVVDYVNAPSRQRTATRHRAESRPDQYVRLAAAELRPVFERLLTFDPTAAEQYDSAKPLWQQPFVTLPPDTPPVELLIEHLQ